MIIAMVKGEIMDVLPYIGASKASCTMCSRYIGAFNQVCKQNIVTKGSHGKAYPGLGGPGLVFLALLRTSPGLFRTGEMATT